MTRAHHTATESEVAYLARALKAPRIGSDYAAIAAQARDGSWTYEEYLAAVLSVEASARAESGARGRIRRAGFPQIKTIDEFDFSTQPTIDRGRIARLETGGWITEAGNVIFLGPPGTGKTHRIHRCVCSGTADAAQHRYGSAVTETEKYDWGALHSCSAPNSVLSQIHRKGNILWKRRYHAGGRSESVCLHRSPAA